MIADDAGNEGAIVIKRGEVGMSAQFQCLFEANLHMAVAALDRAVFVCDAAVVARCHHAIMGNQRGVAPGDIFGIGDGEVAECGRQAVGAMLERYASQCRECDRQTRGQRDIALAAEHDFGMLEAGIGHREVIETVGERDTGDGHAQAVGIGKIRKSHAARHLDLREDHRPLRAIDRAPGPDPPLDRPAHSVIDLVGKTAAKLVVDRHRTQF